MVSALSEARERLRRPPCWGPNEQGDYMVDMTVESYEQDLDVLVAAASIVPSELADALLSLGVYHDNDCSLSEVVAVALKEAGAGSSPKSDPSRLHA